MRCAHAHATTTTFFPTLALKVLARQIGTYIFLPQTHTHTPFFDHHQQQKNNEYFYNSLKNKSERQ